MMMKRLQSFFTAVSCMSQALGQATNCRHLFPPELLLLNIELLAYKTWWPDILTSLPMQDPQREGCRHSGHVLFKVTRSRARRLVLHQPSSICRVLNLFRVQVSIPTHQASMPFWQQRHLQLNIRPPRSPEHDAPRPHFGKKVSSHI